MGAACIVATTVPDLDSARELGGMLVERRLAACAQTIPIESIYRWQGEVERSGEVLVLIKTRQELYQAVEEAIAGWHPYQLPEIVSWPIERGLPGYLGWVAESTAVEP